MAQPLIQGTLNTTVLELNPCQGCLPIYLKAQSRVSSQKLLSSMQKTISLYFLAQVLLHAFRPLLNIRYKARHYARR